jgi:hypothetical protein
VTHERTAASCQPERCASSPRTLRLTKPSTLPSATSAGLFSRRPAWNSPEADDGTRTHDLLHGKRVVGLGSFGPRTRTVETKPPPRRLSELGVGFPRFAVDSAGFGHKNGDCAHSAPGPRSFGSAGERSLVVRTVLHAGRVASFDRARRLGCRPTGGRMSAKTRGGMWCDYCQRPVAGQREGHAVRNTASWLTSGLTGGLSLAGVKTEEWQCPFCGQLVHQSNPPLVLHRRPDQRSRRQSRRTNVGLC